MKKTQIVLLLVIAIMIGALLVTLEDASVYATFEIAEKQKSPDSSQINQGIFTKNQKHHFGLPKK